MTPQETKDIKELILEQEKTGSNDKKLDRKYEEMLVCKLPWKKLKKIVMDEKKTNQIKVS